MPINCDANCDKWIKSSSDDINKIAAVADAQGARIVMETEGKLGRKEVKVVLMCG